MASLAESAGWLFGWLLRNSAQAAVLVLVVWGLERTVLRRLPPRWRYGLWLVVLARLMIPLAPGSPLSLFNLVDWAPSTVAGVFGQVLGLPSPVPVTLVETMHPLADTPPWFLGALALWLPGAVILGVLLARDHQRLQQAMDASPVWDEPTLDLLAQSKAVMGVRRPVELAETTRISSPAISGWWRPRILLPVGLLRRLSVDETRFLFLHELAHVKRGDIALNWLLAAVQILHWFNPFVWLALRRLLSVREEVCDDLVLRRCFMGAAREYGLTLIRILEECAPRRLLPAYAAVLDDIQALRERVRSIRDFSIGESNPWAPALITVLLAVAGLTERADHHALDASPPLPAEVRRSVRSGSRGLPAKPVRPSPSVGVPSRNEAKVGTVSSDATELLLMAMRQAINDIRMPASSVATAGGRVVDSAVSKPAGPQPVRSLAVTPRASAAPVSGSFARSSDASSARAVTVAGSVPSPVRSTVLPPIGRRGDILRPLRAESEYTGGAGRSGISRGPAEGGLYSGRPATVALASSRRPAS